MLIIKIIMVCRWPGVMLWWLQWKLATLQAAWLKPRHSYRVILNARYFLDFFILLCQHLGVLVSNHGLAMDMHPADLSSYPALLCQCQPTRRTFRTTVNCRWPGIQCCRSTGMEQPTGLCHLGRNSDSIPSQT